jgi:hypothetical protein
LLNEHFPFWKNGLTGMAATQMFTAVFLSDEAKKCIPWEQADDGFFTCAENFFSLPQIIREEALFRGINLLNPKKFKNLSKRGFNPKRSVIRRFCTGSITAADLGFVQIKQKNAKIFISVKQKEYYESGFSLLIKQPGLYNLMNISIKVCPFTMQEGNTGFYSTLPVVFRQCLKQDLLYNNGRKITLRNLPVKERVISAVDVYGTAAFINNAGIIYARDVSLETHNERTCYILVNSNGGINV